MIHHKRLFVFFFFQFTTNSKRHIHKSSQLQSDLAGGFRDTYVKPQTFLNNRVLQRKKHFFFFLKTTIKICIEI